MVDAGRERDVLGPVIAAAARALQRLELRKARFPIAQHMGRHPDALGKLADGEHRARHLAFRLRSEEHTSELQSLMRISYAVFCLKKKIKTRHQLTDTILFLLSLVLLNDVQNALTKM